MLIHRVGLEAARFAMREDAETDHPELKCVQIEPTGRVTAADGFMFVRIQANAEQPDLFTEAELPELAIAFDNPVLVPAEAARRFNAACKRKKKGPDVVVVAVEDGKPVTLATTDGKTKGRFDVQRTDLRYPPVDRIAPKGSQRGRITLSVDLLKRLVQTLAACQASYITLTIHDDSDVVPFTAKGLVSETVFVNIAGGVMPMKLPE